MSSRQTTRRLVEYDAIRRRLWIFGQRFHHGATGSLVAALACVGIATDAAGPRLSAESRGKLVLALTGGALMAHDWKDPAIWFERGRGTQP